MIFPGKRNIFPLKSKREMVPILSTSSSKELHNEWKEYFNLLLNNKSDIATASPAPAEIDLPINIDPPSRKETVKAIK